MISNLDKNYINLFRNDNNFIDISPPVEESTLLKVIRYVRNHFPRFTSVSKFIFRVTFLDKLTKLLFPLFSHRVKQVNNAISLEQFRQESKDWPKPDIEEIVHPTPMQTSNHLFEFLLQNQTLWSKKKGQSSAHWEPMPLDGISPVEIHCDGANLIILDKSGEVNYKKIMREWRGAAILDNKTLQKKYGISTEILQQMSAKSYVYLDKRNFFNFKKHWFSFPFLAPVVNLFTGKKLKLNRNEISALAISQRGILNDFYEDGFNCHPVSVGVTTFSVLLKNTKETLIYDPWVPTYCKVIIPAPETSSTAFQPLNIKTAASTLLMIGYEIKSNGDKQLVLKTMPAEVDILGGNPSFKHTYFKPTHAKMRVVPVEGVHQQTPLPQPKILNHALPANASLTQNIDILQTGQGNLAREIRIYGWNAEQKSGYFKKTLEAMDWEFVPAPLPFDPLEILPQQDINGHFDTTVHDYTSSSTKIKGVQNIQLLNFGKGANDSILRFTLQQKTYSLVVHKKLKMISKALGLNSEAYDLIIPQHLHLDEELMKLFKYKTVIPLKFCNKNKDELILKSSQKPFNLEVYLKKS